MKCDLHVHTVHSGMCTVPVLRHVCRESYTDPDELYETLKRRGMDLVTVTDHDSIDAAERLRRHADFFLSEEVTCTLPSGNEIHLGVYGIEERDHLALQQRRDDFYALIAYLRERSLFASVNHAFSALTGPRSLADFALFEEMGLALETRNGAIPEICNEAASAFAAGLPICAGSDAHTLHNAGLVWTEARASQNASEFLEALKQRCVSIGGAHGSYWKLTRDVLSIGVSAMVDNPLLTLSLPLLAFAPAVTLANFAKEHAFASQWTRRWVPEDPRVRNLA
ncbi:MAG: PHP domain-containing protein [Acidobacteria bacterium]|nr:PHP domain-containing protein [Acidobacteriota bacterium]